MAKSIEANTRVIFIANPNNPTGTWVRKGELETFLTNVPDSVVVVLDEAYFEYVMENDYPTGIAYLSRYPNLVVTRTFSKVYGLAGLRIGYGISSGAIADLLNRIRQPFNVNNFAQAAALAALDDDDYVAQSRRLNHAELWRLCAEVEKLGLSYIESVGNFVSIDLGRPAGPIYDALLKQGVIVRPIANYAMPNHLRVTVGLPEENNRFLNALKNCLDKT
jgi:histidinol-phosphate aminotransferase